MTTWAPISAVPDHWREPFVRFAVQGLIATRARIKVEDLADRAEISRIQLEWYHENRGRLNGEAEDELRFRIQSVAPKRIETHDACVDPATWQTTTVGDLDWPSSSLTIGEGPGALNTVLSGIEFDADAARKHGLEASGRKVSIGGSRPEPPRPQRWTEAQMAEAIRDCAIENRDQAWREHFRPIQAEHGWKNSVFRDFWSGARGTAGQKGRPIKRA